MLEQKENQNKIFKEFIPYIQSIHEKITEQLSKYTNTYNEYNIHTTLSNVGISIKKIQELLDIAHKDTNNEDMLNIIENNECLHKFFIIIKNGILKILNGDVYITKNIPTAYIPDMQKELRSIISKFNKLETEFIALSESINNEVIEKITTNISDITDIDQAKDSFLKLSTIFKKNRYIWHIYVKIANIVLENYKLYDNIYAAILHINDNNKNYILAQTQLTNTLDNKSINKSVKDSTNYNNNLSKTYNIIPVSDILDINGISGLIFEITAKNITDFTNICKSKNVDLVLIKNIIGRGIKYSILDLIDYKKTKEYELKTSMTDGITVDTIKRFNTISYIGDSSSYQNIDIQTKYLNKNELNEDVLILMELYPEQFHIMSTTLNEMLTKKSFIIHFLDNIIASQETRINNYNKLINKKIMTNMFLDNKPNMTLLETNSAISQEYIRYNTHKRLMDEFTKQLEKSNKKMDVTKFSDFIHSEKNIQIFSDTIFDMYYEFLDTKLKNNIMPIQVDAYLTLLHKLHELTRNFSKYIHDEFIKRIVTIEAILAEKNNEIAITNLLSDLIKTVINFAVIDDNGLFFNILFKSKYMSTAFSIV